ncbi:MAG: acyl-CoA thioesterase [Thaumarchaeota archaeon]|nr:MAG: acyl-CoA thioesterase [Nitrososphaerota archaeon]TLX94403.1 MAG: acyl-CoA thioesterase [Nitrososphaerota archaeon]
MVLKPKSPEESKAEMTVRMFPSEANPAGNVFGGEILKQIDLISGLVAQRHARTNTVTASIDRVNFLKPVYVGNALILSARLTYVHRSSMEIEIRVEAEDLITGIKTLTNTAYVTAVALDNDGKTAGVPPLLIETEDDKARFTEGEQRMIQRLKERKKN